MLAALILSALLLGELTQGPPPAERPLRDQRTVRDVAELDLTSVSDGSTWVVARITPDRPGGELRAPGASVSQGKLTIPPGAPFIHLLQGAIRNLQTVAGKVADDEWRYSWEIQPERRNSEDGALFSPFRSGGTALLRVDPSHDGGAAYPQIFLLPEDWSTSILAARRRLEQPPGRTVDERRAEAFDVNPFVALHAARGLIREGRLSQAEIRAHLARDKGLRRSVILYLLLRGGTADRPETASAIQELAAESPDASALQDLGLACFAGLQTTTTQEGRQASLELLRAIAARARSLPASTEERAYLEALLKYSGLDERR